MEHAGVLMARQKNNNMIMRAELAKIVDKDGQQLAQLKARYQEELGGPDGDIPVVQQFGMSTNPPKGSHALIFVPNGNMDQAMVLAWEHPGHRPKELNEGEHQLHDTNGNYIKFTSGGIEIVSGSKVVIRAPDIALDGTVYLGGDVGSGVPASKQGTIDTAGHTDVGNLASKVKLT
jgi:phage gp45-like